MKKPLLLFLSLTLWLIPAEVWADKDDPNYPKEDRFHEIYKKFNEVPLSDEDWSRAYGGTQAREYSVVKTDTLWDISKVLFADPVFWPKIWSFNTDEILNPHEIQPGWKIRFFPGTLDTPPALIVTEFEGVAIPPKRTSVPVAQLPDSLPTYIPEIPRFSLPGIRKPDRTELSRVPPLPLPVEIISEKPEYRGKIVEIEDGAKLADEGREVFVSLNGDTQPGSYTIIKNIEKNRYGYIIQYRAEIKIYGRINDSENIYKAKITKMLDSVELGDYLIAGKIPIVDVSEKPKVLSAPFIRIIGGFRSPTDMLFAPYSIVFLDGGASDGIHEGDVMSIYQEPRARIGNSKQKKSYRNIGTVKVIRLQDSLATGYILNSKTEIREGDLAGLEKADSGTDDDLNSDDLSLE